MFNLNCLNHITTLHHPALSASSRCYPSQYSNLLLAFKMHHLRRRYTRKWDFLSLWVYSSETIKTPNKPQILNYSENSLMIVIQTHKSECFMSSFQSMLSCNCYFFISLLILCVLRLFSAFKHLPGPFDAWLIFIFFRILVHKSLTPLFKVLWTIRSRCFAFPIRWFSMRNSSINTGV